MIVLLLLITHKVTVRFILYYLFYNFTSMTINLIGSGNVATILAALLTEKGHILNSIYARNYEKAKALAKNSNVFCAATIADIPKADITIISVTDGAIHEIVNSLSADAQHCVVHTAGSVSKDVFKDKFENYGVLYPLQSIRKDMETIPEIPFLIDGNNEYSFTTVQALAKSLSANTATATDDERKKMHVGAVISCNFVNYMFILAEEFCKKENLEFKVLMPLIKETITRLDTFSPADVQTGPAVRNDRNTIEAHKLMLNDFPETKKIYETLTKSIIERFSKRVK